MAGHTFIVSGEPGIARDTVYSVLESQGFKITKNDEWSAHAERGSQGASVALGAFAGKSGRHVMIDIACATDPQGNCVITLVRGTSGMSGGIIGMRQADQLYADVFNTVGAAYQNAGVLLSGGPF